MSKVLYTITAKDDGSFHVETAADTKFDVWSVVMANRLALTHVAKLKRKGKTWYDRMMPPKDAAE